MSSTNILPAIQVAMEFVAERQSWLLEQGACTIKTDDVYTKGELARAAAAYAMSASGHDYLFATISNDVHPQRSQGFNCGHVTASGVLWPWKQRATSATKRECLVRAGQLLIAEIERLDRISRCETPA